MKKIYTVTNNKTRRTYNYTRFEWWIAELIFFCIGLLIGLLN